MLLIWMCVLLFIVLYCFAVLFMQLLLISITRDPTIAAEGGIPGLFEYYGDTGISIQTLFAVATGGEPWRNAMVPLLECSKWYVIPFYFFIIVVLGGLVNIYIASFVR